MSADHQRIPVVEAVEELAVGRASAAHAEKMADLFRRHNSSLVGFLVARVGSVQEARDIAQQAYAELLALDRPDTISHLSAYLYRTATNLATNRLTQRSQRQRLEPIAFFEATVESPSPEPLWVARERLELIRNAIACLPAKCRMAFVLRIYDELKYADIAARMSEAGIKVDVRTVKRYVAYALERCQHAIQVAEAAERRSP
jgi:RNA polymerase sigma-70 factor (ECF subfamily)